MSTRWAAALLVPLVLLAGGCTRDSSAAEGVPSGKIEQLPADLLPGELNGLRVEREDEAETLQQARRSWAEAVGLYSLRSGDLLQATLQVTRLHDEADPADRDFRRALLNQIGGSASRPIRLGDRTVYVSTGNKQRLSTWFDGDYMFILAVRDDYDRPRTLLRQALELDL